MSLLELICPFNIVAELDCLVSTTLEIGSLGHNLKTINFQNRARVTDVSTSQTISFACSNLIEIFVVASDRGFIHIIYTLMDWQK